MTPSHSDLTFRVGIAAFAILLAIQAIWILPVELTRSSVRTLPTDPATSAVAFARRNDAYWTAWWSRLRSDLWAEAAIAFDWLLRTDDARPAGDDSSLDKARTSVDRALSLGPHRSSIWLLFTALSSRFQWTDHGQTATLKMSYYTGASELSLVPLRLKLALQSDAFEDPEIALFVRRDVRMILTQKPELRPSLVAAYSDASIGGRDFLEQAVTEIDPSFLPTLHATGQP
jgi:hypothetical protein